MADQKLTALTAIAAATADDILYLVEDPLVTPLSRKITFDNFQKSITDVGVIATGTWSAGFGANAIGDADIDWGTGAGQVSAVDIPIADGGGIITGTEVETALQENRTAIDLNTLKDTNVTTNLSLGAGNATTEVIACSDGTDCTLIEADTDNAGLLGADKWDEIVANTLKDTNVTTNLSLGAGNATTEVIACSDGTDCTLIEADTDNAGLLGADKWDEIVANTSASHSQNTDTALGSGCVAADHGTAATDEVINICYGTGEPPDANTTTIGSLFVKYTA